MTEDANVGPPPFDARLAQRLIGKRVIIGLTSRREDDSVDRQEQLHGPIVQVTDGGIAVQVSGRSDLYWLPPDLRNWRQAPEGEYRLRSTGEVVVNPDYLTDWTVRPQMNRTGIRDDSRL